MHLDIIILFASEIPISSLVFALFSFLEDFLFMIGTFISRSYDFSSFHFFLLHYLSYFDRFMAE